MAVNVLKRTNLGLLGILPFEMKPNGLLLDFS